MNIIIEGIDGVGKTTLINNINNYLNGKVNIINEIEEFPLYQILRQMLKEDPFFKSNKNFKTSIYESFILAADFFYKQEFYRENEESINIYDRDFLTLLCYQKVIIEKEYGEKGKRFFENFSECIFFDLKEIEVLVYIKISLEESFNRIEKRDKKKLTQEQKEFLKKVKYDFEEYWIPKLINKKIKILIIDNQIETKEIVNLILGEKNEEITYKR